MTALLSQLFPGATVHARRLTLAPPLARRLLPRFWALAAALERVQVANTHYLALIQPL